MLGKMRKSCYPHCAHKPLDIIYRTVDSSLRTAITFISASYMIRSSSLTSGRHGVCVFYFMIHCHLTQEKLGSNIMQALTTKII